MRRRKSFWNAVAVGAVLLASVTPSARSHHSFSMFDPKRELTLTGTVKEFQWTNPHVFIQLAVRGPTGTQEWSIEMTSPAHLVRNGWKPTRIRAGDVITAKVWPLRDGRPGGQYVSAVDSGGKPIGKTAIATRGDAP